jgi:hypothetical protein
MGGRWVPIAGRDTLRSVRHLTHSAHTDVTPVIVADAAPATVRTRPVTGATDVLSTAVQILSPRKRTPGLRGRERCGG